MSAPPRPARVLVFKPDEIGDFLLATGAIRLLAEEAGEENLHLAVTAPVVPLARAEFPAARVIPLTFRKKRKVLNVTTVNILKNLPAWHRFFLPSFDAALCFRSMRNYLQTILFFSARARRRIACENLLSFQKRQRRPLVEKAVASLFKPELLPYPQASGGSLPMELEANRRVVSRYFGKEISDVEILPVLKNLRAASRQNFCLLAPFSSSVQKDYPAALWARALRLFPGTEIRLAAAAYQDDALRTFEAALRTEGISRVSRLDPCPLPEFARAVDSAALVLTVDTAAAHFACALRRPAVIAGSGRHPGMYGPYSADDRQLWLYPEEPFDKKRWHEKLPPEKIVDAIRKLLPTWPVS